MWTGGADLADDIDGGGNTGVSPAVHRDHAHGCRELAGKVS